GDRLTVGNPPDMVCDSDHPTLGSPLSPRSLRRARRAGARAALSDQEARQVSGTRARLVKRSHPARRVTSGRRAGGYAPRVPLRPSLAWAPLALLPALPAAAVTLPAGFEDALVVAVPGPTAIAFTPDGRTLVTQQSGTLRVFEGGTLRAALVLPVCANSE